jgi:D-amino-acid dehydrogenase
MAEDVLVIGGGIAGLCCAYFLRRRGAAVTVLERGAIAGPQSCSYGNTGLAGTQGAMPLAEPGVPAQGLRWLLNPESPFYLKPRLDPQLAAWLWRFRRHCTERAAQRGFRVLLELKKQSLQILRELCAAGPLAACFAADGMVVAFKTAQAFDKAAGSVAGAVAAGVPLRVLTPAELATLEPGVEFDIHGALYNSEGARLRVPEFIDRLGRLLEGMAVRVRTGTDVTGFEVADGRIRRVRTTRGDFTPDEVVIAAGAWSAECARKLGLRLPLQPARGYSITVPVPRGAPRRPVLLSEGKVAIAPFGDRLRIGGTLELSGLAPSGLDNAVPARRIEGIRRTVRASLPGLPLCWPGGTTPPDPPARALPGDAEIWSGLRPCTPDGIPFVGRAPAHRNLYFSCGHGHTGMGLAPASGKLLAQLMAGEQPDADPAPLRVERFRGAGPR